MRKLLYSYRLVLLGSILCSWSLSIDATPTTDDGDDDADDYDLILSLV